MLATPRRTMAAGAMGFLVLATAFFAAGGCSTTDDGSPSGAAADAGRDGAALAADGALPEASALLPPSRQGPAAPRNGSRIQHQRWQTADGAEIAAGLVDTKLGVACSPTFLTDGQLHCVPEAAAIDTRAPWFTDETCTAPLATASAKCGPRRFATRATSADSCGNVEVFAVTSTYGDGDVSKQYSPGVCSLTGRSGDTDYYRFDQASPLSPGDFVRFTPAERAIGPRISARVYEGDDGSVVPTGSFVDTARGKDCTFAEAPAIGGDLRCLPLTRFVRIANYFLDEDCSMPLAGELPDSCTRTATYDGAVAIDRDVAACGGTTRHVFHLGDVVTTTLYSKDVTCTGPRTVASGSLTTVGAEILPEELPALPMANVGGARVQIAGVSANGSTVPLEQLFDATTQQPCRIHLAADGKMRCLPHASFVVGWFKDSACTSPIASVPASCPAAKYFTRPADDGCGVRTTVLTLGAPVDPIDGKLWYGAPGSCGRYTVAVDERYFELGPEASPELFAEAIRTTL